MLRVGLHENIFILFLLAIKTAGSAQKLRVGRVSGNTATFCLRLNPKFPISSHLLYLYSSVCVGPGRKPHRFLITRLIILFQAERALWAPGAVFAVCCIGVVIGMMYIPETSGVELPQTMDELSAHYTNKHWTIRRNVSDANTQQKREVLVRNNGEEK